MKKAIFIVLLITSSLLSKSQSILSDTIKYQVKKNQSYVEAQVPMKCGDNETIKSVQVIIYIDKMDKMQVDSMLNLSTIEILNIKAKYKCKNTYSWKPTKISILGREGTISAIVKGSAENAYGSRGEATSYFNWKNGEFVDL